MKKFISFIFFVTLFSCNNKKEIALPKGDYSIQTKIYDHSPVYIFLTTEKNDTLAKVNRRSTISSTNWVFSIDKHLRLKNIIPEIIKLQEKKKNSPHKKEGAINVFSYADSLSKNLAFFPFTKTEYIYNNQFSKFYIKKHINIYMGFKNIRINFNKDATITIDGTLVLKNEFHSFLTEYISALQSDKLVLLHLNFDEEITYQDYITNKLLVQKEVTANIKIAPKEFIYNKNKLPKCNCIL